MRTLVRNCRVVLIYSIVRLISHDQIAPGGGGNSAYERMGMLVGNFELNP